eukprot:TRINITY_DN667_c0_g1_i1.p1 TRINITY_DN667_c0_g1~~TRINITY_DN667_c0_g1_i1.p1  ORF type:complete len:258 (-),score=60.36 TRINITY_DN667_c0_g1_i1:95-868(-)
MIIKEFRILLPLQLEEYQVGQLYSVAKTSSQETSNGEGVEVVKNEPYSDEHSSGQYTEKIYHLGSRLPGWVKAFIPGTALTLEEKAWNAYPYCKTVLRSPWMGDSFTFIIESRHAQDNGEQENIHKLTPDQLKKREVDNIDISTEKAEKKDYKESEDPTLVRSEKADRGPLTEGWKQKKPIMCCYKLVTVEFKKFGLQGTVENFLMKFERDLFLKFHKQVYCWLDEWFGMSIQDVRDYEKRTKEELDNKLAQGEQKE